MMIVVIIGMSPHLVKGKNPFVIHLKNGLFMGLILIFVKKGLGVSSNGLVAGCLKYRRIGVSSRKNKRESYSEAHFVVWSVFPENRLFASIFPETAVAIRIVVAGRMAIVLFSGLSGAGPGPDQWREKGCIPCPKCFSGVASAMV